MRCGGTQTDADLPSSDPGRALEKHARYLQHHEAAGRHDSHHRGAHRKCVLKLKEPAFALPPAFLSAARTHNAPRQSPPMTVVAQQEVLQGSKARTGPKAWPQEKQVFAPAVGQPAATDVKRSDSGRCARVRSHRRVSAFGQLRKFDGTARIARKLTPCI